MGLIVLPGHRTLTPLRLGAAITDRVSVPYSTLHSGLVASTVLMTVRPITLTSGRRLFQKELGFIDWAAELSGTAGDIVFYQGYFSGHTERVTNDTPIARLNRWTALAFAINAVNDFHIFHGPLGSALRESTYGSQTNTATGAPLNNGTNPFIWGNRADNDRAFQGDFAFGAIVGRALTLADVNEFFASGILPPDVRFAAEFGANGRGIVPDISGNGLHATLTGAIPREAVRVPWSVPARIWVPVAGGASNGSVSEGGVASDAFAAQVDTTAAVSEGSKAGDAITAQADTLAAVTDGAHAGDTFAAQVDAAVAISEGAIAGDTQLSGGDADASATEGALSGDAFAAQVDTAAAISDGAEAGFALGYTTDIDTADEGALSGDSFGAQVDVACSVGEGAKAGDTFSATTADAGVGATSEGALSGDVLAAQVDVSQANTDGAVGSDSYTAQVDAAAPVSEGARAGDSWNADTEDAINRAVIHGAVAGDAYSPLPAVVVSNAEGARAGDAFVVFVEIDALISEGAIAGDGFAGVSGAFVRRATVSFTLHDRASVSFNLGEDNGS